METIWLEIDGDEMMATDFAIFLEILSVYDMQYASYYDENNNIVMEVRGDMTESFDEHLVAYMNYQPIVQLDEEPNISDIDLIEEMTNMDQ